MNRGKGRFSCCYTNASINNISGNGRVVVAAAAGVCCGRTSNQSTVSVPARRSEDAMFALVIDVPMSDTAVDSFLPADTQHALFEQSREFRCCFADFALSRFGLGSSVRRRPKECRRSQSRSSAPPG